MSDDQTTEILESFDDVTDGRVEDAEASDTAASGATTPSDGRPALRARTRWAGIVWGLVLAAMAIGGVWLASGEARIDDLVAWIAALSPATAIGLGVLTLGALILVTGLVGLLRRAQRAVAGRK
ncbi:hypothetical protein [Microbacterium sp. bgisy203]|uniref:hypothetical protein n=1 Tax=Microbacterium sp. bgisy203 TaxID=3413799 RepID=UPI003D72372F